MFKGRDGALSEKSVRNHRNWAIIGGIVVLITVIFVCNVFLRERPYLSSPEILAKRLVLKIGEAPEWSLVGEGLPTPFVYRFLSVCNCWPGQTAGPEFIYFLDRIRRTLVCVGFDSGPSALSVLLVRSQTWLAELCIGSHLGAPFIHRLVHV